MTLILRFFIKVRLTDPQKATGKITILYVPNFMFLDKQGKIRMVAVGTT